MSESVAKRDVFLDVSKGFAIMLVVLGHVFQGAHQDFDAYFPFRVIYSFHMPMFFCLSGMVASLKIQEFFPNISIREEIQNTKKEVLNATLRLLIPFVAWTIVSYFINHNDGTLTYFKDVIKSPDWSLWFLLALFYCRTLYKVIEAAGVLSLKIAKRLFVNNLCVFKCELASALFIYICFCVFRKYFPDFFGLYFLKSYFLFYVLGIFMYRHKDIFINRKNINLICFAVFCLLVPFWRRTTSGPVEDFLSNIMSSGNAAIFFRYTVAISGTITFLCVVKFFIHVAPRWAITAVCFIGSLTLGIYALHGYFLQIYPPFWGSLFVSVLVVVIIKRIPFLNIALLGENYCTRRVLLFNEKSA